MRRTVFIWKIIADFSYKHQLQNFLSRQRQGRRINSALTAATIALAVLVSPRLFTTCDKSRLKDDDAANFELFLTDLQGILTADDIELDEDERKQRGKPWNSYHKVDSYPMVIVSPNSTDQVWSHVLVTSDITLCNFLSPTSKRTFRSSDRKIELVVGMCALGFFATCY